MDTNTQTDLQELKGWFLPYLPQLGVPEDDLRDGFETIDSYAQEIIIQLKRANKQGVRLSDACNDLQKFQRLTQVNVFIKDIMHYRIPSQYQSILKTILDQIQPNHIKKMKMFVFLSSQDPKNLDLQIWCKFILFQINRIEIILFSIETPNIYETGFDDEQIDLLAEKNMNDFVNQKDVSDILQQEDVDLIKIMLARVKLLVINVCRDFSLEIATLGKEAYDKIKEKGKLRTEIKKELAHFPPDEIVLIQNKFSTAFGSEQLTIERLQEKHILLAKQKRNTLDQKLKRSCKKLGQSKKERKNHLTVGQCIQILNQKGEGQ